MKKLIIAILMLAISASIVSATDWQIFEKVDYAIKIGNENYESNYPSYIRVGRMYLPLRSFCDALGIPVEWDEENKEVKVDIYNKKLNVSSHTQYKEEGVIPDEETALAVGKIILEKYTGKPMEYENEDWKFYLNARYIQSLNAWCVSQTAEIKHSGGGGGGAVPTVYINRNTGEVMYIHAFSSFE